MNKILVLLIALTLTACQSTVVTKPKLEAVRIPSELLDCGAVKPSVPKYDKLKNKEITRYISNLIKVIDECELDVHTIKELTDQYNELVKKFNEENT